MELAAITDPEALLDEIEKLADEKSRLEILIREQTVRAVHHLGAKRMGAAAAANISRPTLNAWLDAYAEQAGAEWETTGV